MILSEKRGKCSTILFTNRKNERQPIVLMNNKPLESIKSTKLLGIILDSKLTFVDHFKMVKNEISQRINQLQSVTNCCFGPTQLSLRNMYVAYIRSVLDYAAPVWYPFLSASNIYKLEIL